MTWNGHGARHLGQDIMSLEWHGIVQNIREPTGQPKGCAALPCGL